MFIVKPTPRQIAKLNPNKGSNFVLSPTWADFARSLTIRSGKGFAKFDPFSFQLELSDLVDGSTVTMLAKSRQLGASEFSLSKILYAMLETPGLNAVVVSRRLLDAYKLGYRMVQMIDSIALTTRKKSAQEIVLMNQSRVMFCEPGDSSGRGEASVSYILLDEFSFMKEPELTIGSVMPATSMLGDDYKLLIVYTPNGKSHYSYQLLAADNPDDFALLPTIEAVRSGELPGLFHWRDNAGWLKILLHWRVHPIYSQQEDYLKNVAKKQKLSWKKTLREHDLSFDESELQYISDALISECSTGEYEPYSEEFSCYAGLDSSSVGADWFCFAVLKSYVQNGIQKLSLVHLYRQRRKSMKRHLRKILEILDEYQIENTCVEVNSFGALYYQELNDERRFMNFTPFNASKNSNVRILESLLMRMETHTIVCPKDSIVLRELAGLEEDPISGRIEAGSTGVSNDESGESELHDDIPRAIALAIHAYNARPKLNGINPEALKRLLSKGIALSSEDALSG